MSISNCSGIETNECLYCNGAWINSDALEHLLQKENDAPSKSEIKTLFNSEYDKSSNRCCPECDNEKLYQIYIHNVELDLCSKCSGLFFDEGELKEILPRTHKPNRDTEAGVYVASEGLLWVLLGFLGGG